MKKCMTVIVKQDGNKITIETDGDTTNFLIATLTAGLLGKFIEDKSILENFTEEDRNRVIPMIKDLMKELHLNHMEKQ